MTAWIGSEPHNGADPWPVRSAPPTPINLTVTPDSPTQNTLTWSAIPEASGYDIERDGVVIVYAHPTTTYTDTAGTGTSSYRVRSVD